MITNSPQTEFWFHVASQQELPIAGDVPKFIEEDALKGIIDFFVEEGEITKERLQDLIKINVENIDILRAIVGVSDKRMYLELSLIFHKAKFNATDTINILGGNFYNVNRHPLSFFKRKISDKNPALAVKSLSIITDYLDNKGVLAVLNSLKKIGTADSYELIDILINTKEAQQKLTKRRGHGMEQVFAQNLHELGVSFFPNDRHINPMSKDPNVNRETLLIQAKVKNRTWAFDIIILRDEEPHVFTQSLIHTSDPGQFGVNKSDETVTIKKTITAYNDANKTEKELWGLVDGVGFTENKTNTLDKMLSEFDCFVQLKTLYKIALQLHKIDLVKIIAIKFDSSFYTEEEARAMFDKYGSDNIEFYFGDATPKGRAIKAGKAWVYL